MSGSHEHTYLRLLDGLHYSDTYSQCGEKFNSRDRTHGQLARSCELCEVIADRAALARGSVELNAEVSRLSAVIEGAWAWAVAEKGLFGEFNDDDPTVVDINNLLTILARARGHVHEFGEWIPGRIQRGEWTPSGGSLRQRRFCACNEFEFRDATKAEERS